MVRGMPLARAVDTIAELRGPGLLALSEAEALAKRAVKTGEYNLTAVLEVGHVNNVSGPHRPSHCNILYLSDV